MPTCPACGAESPEGFRFCGACGAGLDVPGPERRKLATILFCDVVGSTRLGEQADPETVRELMFRYFHTMRGAIERHGGTVEKFAGDAVMAVFGVPVAHEDDALRACRAALEMQERLEELNHELHRRYATRLAARIGVNTGEVIAGDAATAETLVTGDAVNVAARLEQAAAAGEVLIGEQTYRLTRGMVEAEAIDPIDAKGKAEAVPAYRLAGIDAAAGAPPLETPLVGREDELARLLRAFSEASGQRSCRLVTVLGEPGVGKSRLAAELEQRVAPQAQILRGRCLPYGEGITFWPIAEVVRQAAGLLDEHSPDEALARIVEVAGDVAVGERVAQAIGVAAGASTADETAWAIRRLLGEIARRRPCLLIIDDVQWAEEALVEVIAGLPDRVDDAAMLVLLLGRPEFMESHPDWPSIVMLETLGDAAAIELATRLTGERELAVAVVERACGNPLFLEELAALLAEDGASDELPTTLNALLAARLDHLGETERSALERGAVEGEVFHRGAVAELADDGRVVEALPSLRESGVLRPARAAFVGEAAFAFRHILLRDAAYQGLAKRARADLHERVAGWLERAAGRRLAEYEEIVGYHLERSYRYLEELGPVDERGGELGERAAERLFAAGRRADDRGDVAAATNLHARAVALTSPDAPERPWRLVSLGNALFQTGEFEPMDAAFEEAERRARERGDRRMELFARVDGVRFRVERGDMAYNDQLLAVAEDAVPVFEAAGDDLGLARAWAAIADYHHWRMEIRPRQEAYERALLHARRAEDGHMVMSTLARLAGAFTFGPYPVEETIERIERELENPAFPARGVWTAFLAELEACRGRVDRARELSKAARAHAAETGNVIAGIVISGSAFEVERMAGDLEASEAIVRESVGRLEELGHGWAASWRAELAWIVLEQGRLDEAEELLEGTDAKDSGQLSVRALLHARRAEHQEAEQAARKAVAVYESTDATPLQAQLARMLAEVLQLGGKPAEARTELERALAIEEARGATLKAERTRALLADLGSA